MVAVYSLSFETIPRPADLSPTSPPLRGIFLPTVPTQKQRVCKKQSYPIVAHYTTSLLICQLLLRILLFFPANSNKTCQTVPFFRIFFIFYKIFINYRYLFTLSPPLPPPYQHLSHPLNSPIRTSFPALRSHLPPASAPFSPHPQRALPSAPSPLTHTARPPPHHYPHPRRALPIRAPQIPLFSKFLLHYSPLCAIIFMNLTICSKFVRFLSTFEEKIPKNPNFQVFLRFINYYVIVKSFFFFT